uniref:Uncharacterized protein n=1 Tax=Rhizophora mucronata TaxID=61149 RepID=A0A2P2Q2D0_RHIMU
MKTPPPGLIHIFTLTRPSEPAEEWRQRLIKF